MKNLLALVFVLGLTISSISFATEDASGGDCKNKAESSVSKEEVIALTSGVESEEVTEEVSNQ